MTSIFNQNIYSRLELFSNISLESYSAHKLQRSCTQSRIIHSTIEMQGVSIRAMKGTIVLVIEVHQATMLTPVKLTLVCIIALPQYWVGRALHQGRWIFPTGPEGFLIGPIHHLSIGF